jgi:hypothetical protein
MKVDEALADAVHHLEASLRAEPRPPQQLRRRVRAQRLFALTSALLTLATLTGAILVTRANHQPTQIAVERAGGIGSDLPVPAIGKAIATWLDDGTPVFVVNDRTLGPQVVVARGTHRPFGVGGLVAWCPSANDFEALIDGSKYDVAGRKLDGPAPVGLPTYAYTSRGEPPNRIRVTAIRPGAPLGTPGAARVGASCDGTTRFVLPVIEHLLPRTGEPVYTPIDAIHHGRGVVQITATWVFRNATAALCSRLDGARCVDPVPVVDFHSERASGAPTRMTGLWLAHVEDNGLADVVAVRVSARQ